MIEDTYRRCAGMNVLLEKHWCREVLLSLVSNGTGKTPSAFPQDRLRLDFRSSLEVGDALGAVLEGLLVG